MNVTIVANIVVNKQRFLTGALPIGAAVLLAACQSEAASETAAHESAAATRRSGQAAETAAPAAPIPANRHAYSSLDLARCELIEKNEEEGGYYLHRCPGVAGIKLELVESDLRQELAIIAPGKARVALELPSRVGGGGFSQLGKTIEWRGPAAAFPRTLIARYAVAQGAEPTKPDISYLVVARLKPRPCVVAVIEPGPGQNDKARTIADGALPACRKP